MTGRVDDAAALRAYTEALPAMTFTVYQLNADSDTLTDRMLRRGRGEGPAIPGDELKGQPAAVLRQAAQAAGRLSPAGFADLLIDIDECSVADLVSLIAAKTGGWPTHRQTRPHAPASC